MAALDAVEMRLDRAPELTPSTWTALDAIVQVLRRMLSADQDRQVLAVSEKLAETLYHENQALRQEIALLKKPAMKKGWIWRDRK